MRSQEEIGVVGSRVVLEVGTVCEEIGVVSSRVALEVGTVCEECLLPLRGGVCPYDPEHTPMPEDLADPEIPEWYLTWLHMYQERDAWPFWKFGPLPKVVDEVGGLAPSPTTGLAVGPLEVVPRKHRLIDASHRWKDFFRDCGIGGLDDLFSSELEALAVSPPKPLPAVARLPAPARAAAARRAAAAAEERLGPPTASSPSCAATCHGWGRAAGPEQRGAGGEPAASAAPVPARLGPAAAAAAAPGPAGAPPTAAAAPAGASVVAAPQAPPPRPVASRPDGLGGGGPGDGPAAGTRASRIAEWLKELDPVGALDCYEEALVAAFASPAEVAVEYVREVDGKQVVDPGFFQLIGVRKLGHKRLFEKWFADRV